MPITGEFPERAIQKDHLNARWPLQSIARGEMLPDAFEMNIDSGFEMAFILPENLDPAAPRQKVRILRQDECHLEARVNIHFKGIRQHFTTRNTLQRPTRIEMVFLDGPFRKF